MKFELPKLLYSYNALEPYIDALTMEIHYAKHHQGYVNNLNAALEKHPELSDWSLENLLRKIKEVPEDIRVAVQNNAGGHYNHSLFWTIMKNPGQGGDGEPSGDLASEITETFGNFASFKDLFSKTAAARFGSGWAWLAVDKRGNLKVYSTPNQDCPLTEGLIPVMGLDVWEHAYYLKYQNRRPEYIQNWWNVINWQKVAENYSKLLALVKK